MGIEEKWFQDKQGATQKLIEDVGANNVKVYSINDYAAKIQLDVHPVTFISGKCTHVEVACSGEVSSGNDWILIASYRLDTTRDNKKCYDIDPILLFIDGTEQSPSNSGVIAFHQDFEGRTSAVGGYDYAPYSQTVQVLRDKLITGVQPLESGHYQTLNALSFMHKKYGPMFDQKGQ